MSPSLITINIAPNECCHKLHINRFELFWTYWPKLPRISVFHGLHKIEIILTKKKNVRLIYLTKNDFTLQDREIF